MLVRSIRVSLPKGTRSRSGIPANPASHMALVREAHRIRDGRQRHIVFAQQSDRLSHSHASKVLPGCHAPTWEDRPEAFDGLIADFILGAKAETIR